jgi:hypothetical protein
MISIAEKVNTPATQEAYIYALIETASLKLLQGQVDSVRKDLDAANRILDTFDSVDTVIHAAFYRVSADYYSVCFPVVLSLICRAKSITRITTAMPFSILLVFLNLLRFQKKILKSVHIISALQPSSARKSTTLENYYFIPFSMNSKLPIAHGCEIYYLQ